MIDSIVKPKKISAVFKKQIKDTFKNKMTLIQFVMFPLLALIFTEAIAKGQQDLPNTFFVTMFSSIYVGMVPMVNMAAIISEEKEQNTLKALMLANVKPYQYLTGTGTYVFMLCIIGAVMFGLIGGYGGMVFMKFIAAMLCGIVLSLLLGSAVGMLSKNQMSATAIVIPVSMILAFLPMIATFNSSFESVSRFLYTQQIKYLLSNPKEMIMTLERFLIMGGNLLIFLGVFIFAYRKG